MCLPWVWFYVQRRLCLPHLQLALKQSTELVHALGFLQGPGYFRKMYLYVSLCLCGTECFWSKEMGRTWKLAMAGEGWALQCCVLGLTLWTDTNSASGLIWQSRVYPLAEVWEGDLPVFKWTRDKQIFVNGLHLLCLLGAGQWLHLQLYLQAASGSLCWRNKAAAYSSAMRKRKKSTGQEMAGRQESGGRLTLAKTIRKNPPLTDLRYLCMCMLRTAAQLVWHLTLVQAFTTTTGFKEFWDCLSWVYPSGAKVWKVYWASEGTS